MSTLPSPARRTAGFTVAEILITMTIGTLAMAGALGVLITGMRAMYRDTQRLATDSALRRLTMHVTKETVDSSEFYVLPTYESLDGSINLETDISPLAPEDPEPGQPQLAAGDCLVLVTRKTVEKTANVRQFRIYYRVAKVASAEGPLRYYESTNYGTDGTTTALATLLNGVNLKTTPTLTGSRVLAEKTRGKPKKDGSGYHPVFSTEATVPSATNESVSLNIEVITGTTVNNLLSSSTFNYTISPRR